MNPLDLGGEGESLSLGDLDGKGDSGFLPPAPPPPPPNDLCEGGDEEGDEEKDRRAPSSW